MNILKSRTVWVIILTFVIGGVQMLQPFMSPELFVLTTGVLGALAVYFRVNPQAEF